MECINQVKEESPEEDTSENFEPAVEFLSLFVKEEVKEEQLEEENIDSTEEEANCGYVSSTLKGASGSTSSNETVTGECGRGTSTPSRRLGAEGSQRTAVGPEDSPPLTGCPDSNGSRRRKMPFPVVSSVVAADATRLVRHQCETCGKSFVYPSDLVRHAAIHRQDRPFECPVCGQAFKHKSSVAQHVKLHSGEKRFSCEECGKTFKFRSGLTVHMYRKNRSHAGRVGTPSHFNVHEYSVNEFVQCRNARALPRVSNAPSG